MRITTELTIRGEPARLECLLARVEALLRDGWKRDRDAEERRQRHWMQSPLEYCFSCTAKADRPAAAFWVRARSEEELYIPHVFSLQKQKLSEEECLGLLAEFDREFVRPAGAEMGVESEVVQHRLTLEHDLSAEAARLLRAFSTSANRASLDFNNRRRWNAFLVRVHQDESYFAPALLDEWLMLEGWAKEMRDQLVGEYQVAQSLLVFYDEEVAIR